MYESPIKILEGVTNHIMRETEDGIVCEIQKQYRIDVDKEELTKALQYDRHQYDRGYADGKNSALDSVLDKIKAEIEINKEKWWYGVNDDCFMKLSDVLEIIDKYKAERECEEET